MLLNSVKPVTIVRSKIASRTDCQRMCCHNNVGPTVQFTFLNLLKFQSRRRWWRRMGLSVWYGSAVHDKKLCWPAEALVTSQPRHSTNYSGTALVYEYNETVSLKKHWNRQWARWYHHPETNLMTTYHIYWFEAPLICETKTISNINFIQLPTSERLLWKGSMLQITLTEDGQDNLYSQNI